MSDTMSERERLAQFQFIFDDGPHELRFLLATAVRALNPEMTTDGAMGTAYGMIGDLLEGWHTRAAQRIAALEAVADQLRFTREWLRGFPHDIPQAQSVLESDIDAALARLDGAQETKPNEPPPLDPRYQNGCYGDGR